MPSKQWLQFLAFRRKNDYLIQRKPDNVSFSVFLVTTYGYVVNCIWRSNWSGQHELIIWTSIKRRTHIDDFISFFLKWLIVSNNEIHFFFKASKIAVLKSRKVPKPDILCKIFNEPEKSCKILAKNWSFLQILAFFLQEYYIILQDLAKVFLIILQIVSDTMTKGINIRKMYCVIAARSCTISYNYRSNWRARVFVLCGFVDDLSIFFQLFS